MIQSEIFFTDYDLSNRPTATFGKRSAMSGLMRIGPVRRSINRVSRVICKPRYGQLDTAKRSNPYHTLIHI